jgi:hypothetical protein
LKDEIENQKKLEIKRRWKKLKIIIYDKLELRTKLKKKFTKRPSKKYEIKTIRTAGEKNKICQIGIE